MDDIAVALEHVNLLNGRDGLSVELLEGLLKLLVVTARSLRSPLNLPPRSTLATVFPLPLESRTRYFLSRSPGSRFEWFGQKMNTYPSVTNYTVKGLIH